MAVDLDELRRLRRTRDRMDREYTAPLRVAGPARTAASHVGSTSSSTIPMPPRPSTATPSASP